MAFGTNISPVRFSNAIKMLVLSLSGCHKIQADKAMVFTSHRCTSKHVTYSLPSGDFFLTDIDFQQLEFQLILS